MLNCIFFCLFCCTACQAKLYNIFPRFRCTACHVKLYTIYLPDMLYISSWYLQHYIFPAYVHLYMYIYMYISKLYTIFYLFSCTARHAQPYSICLARIDPQKKNLN